MSNNQSEKNVNGHAPSGEELVEDAESVMEDAQGIVDDEDTRDASTEAMVDELDDGQADADDPLETLQAELAEAQAKADEYLDRLQRTAAEFQNSRRRMENQLSEAVERANASLISRLLPLLDDLDLAFQNVPEGLQEKGDQAAWLEGFVQIRKKLLDTLAEQGVTPVEAEGEFDPHQHEAISSEPSDTVESGHVIALLRAGYEYKGRVLRPALVRVAM